MEESLERRKLFNQGNIAIKNILVEKVLRGGNDFQDFFLAQCLISCYRYFFDVGLVAELRSFLVLGYAQWRGSGRCDDRKNQKGCAQPDDFFM